MNLLVIEPSEFLDNYRIALNSRKSEHIITVLKKQVGDRIRAAILDKAIGNFLIESIDAQRLNICGSFYPENLTSVVAPSKNVILISAIQRPQTVKKILQNSCTWGISKVVFFVSQKSEKSYLNSPIWKPENLDYEMILGLEQGKRFHRAKVVLIQDRLDLYKYIDLSNSVGFIMDISGSSLNSYRVQLQSMDNVYIVIGPESGFIPTDIGYFENIGFHRVSLSTATLRSETALDFALAQIEFIIRG